MKTTFANQTLRNFFLIAGLTASSCLCASGRSAAQQTAANGASAAASTPAAGVKSFETPQQAADALVVAAENFDENALAQIFGSGGNDIYLTGEYPQDRRRAAEFAAEAREKKTVSVDPKTGN